jgi:hypothetical protein
MINYLIKTKQQKQVGRVIKKLIAKFPSSGKEHIQFLDELFKNNKIPFETATAVAYIIENPKCNYHIKKNGDLVIENSKLN